MSDRTIYRNGLPFGVEKNQDGTYSEKVSDTFKSLFENESKAIEVLGLQNYKYPTIMEFEPEIFQPGGTSRSFRDIDKDGNLWFVRWDGLIQKSENASSFQTVFESSDFLEDGESINGYALIVSDTGRIIAATSNGRVFVSDEDQTEMTEAFQFKGGYTQNSWGFDKQGKYIVMGAYLKSKNAENPGREVYLSKDHGETWDLIFDKPINDMLDASDYHIHDVAFDTYSNMILVSVGDGVNRQIHYSYNYGDDWHDLFPEDEWGTTEMAPIHPTSILCFPEGIAFGSDELPEGISWWNRPKTDSMPNLKWEDIEYKITFGRESDTLIGTFATKGRALTSKEYGFIAVMPFRNHQTSTEGHTRLFATGDGGRSWHQIYKAPEWSSQNVGFMNAFPRVEEDGVYIYSHYSIDGDISLFKAKMPDFITL